MSVLLRRHLNETGFCVESPAHKCEAFVFVRKFFSIKNMTEYKTNTAADTNVSTAVFVFMSIVRAADQQLQWSDL